MLLVVIPVLVLFAVVLAWAIREGREMGLLGQVGPVAVEVVSRAPGLLSIG